MKILIGNINKNNHSYLNAAAARAGYAASVEMADETSATIDLGDGDHRKACEITVADVERMIGVLVLLGFSVQRV